MENGINGNHKDLNHNISCEDVISKLKDDGDFDKLRIKIIRKIKENEELRKSIVSIVKESESINRPGAENMKARQLSDAIHQEVGKKLNEQVSVALWEVIRSPEGMKTEITETVKSVYEKLLSPKRMQNVESAVREVTRGRVGELQELTGFSQTVSHKNLVNTMPVRDIRRKESEKETDHRPLEVVENGGTRDGSDEELDAPPGFG